MVLQRGQAWITYVPEDSAVTSALILAASLRRAETTKRIGVIVSKKVSNARALTIRENFDDYYVIDECLISCGNEDGEMQGKIFMFSLTFYEKCIFMTANTLVLENCDKLFDKGEHAMFQTFGNDTEMFLFAPRLALCRFLQANRAKTLLNKDHSEIYNQDFQGCIEGWLSNNYGNRRNVDTFEPTVTLANISATNGKLNWTGYQIKISDLTIHFTDVPNDYTTFADKMQQLWKDENLGTYGKAIILDWTKIYEELESGILKEPRYLENLQNNVIQEPIAIVGMSCRFPGANNLEEFWNLLYSGQEGIREPPIFRWRKEHSIFGDADKERKTKAGFLSVPVDDFDYKFFGISPKEAAFLDPQARLLHEVVWESLENGGIDPLSLRGSHTGVFTGSWMNDYKDIIQTSAERDFFRTYMGNSIGASAARLSSLLGLTGPSIATESGCSSAMVAVDLAVKSLRNGESNLALAGGVNLLLHPFQSNVLDYVFASDGRCKTFDEKADGFGRAEGCGVLVLKRLSDALQDKDNIWGVIRGSAVSQEGLSRSMGTPTVHCEALAMSLAMRNAGVKPEQVSFVEAHGTGTAVGDPMEVAAIAKAYHSEGRKEPLIIGSVKTNLGHTESVSGITGIIKTVLAMQQELIPKHLNLEVVNPQINLDAIPAKIPLEPLPWPKIPGQPRLAGVSSFGITGTDGHVILEEAPDITLPQFNLGLERPLHLVKLSAKTGPALEKMVDLYTEYFRKGEEHSFSNVAFTANTGRASFGHRAFLLANSYEQVRNNALQTNKVFRSVEKTGGKLCFLFTGQGSQYPGMAKALYNGSPVFRVHFDQCDFILREKYNVSIRPVLWSNDSQFDNLGRTIYSQTSLFCVEYCLLKLWESWGLKPDYVLGHSLGEFCAAVAADILTFEDGLKLVAERSRLIENLPPGNMLVIKTNLLQVQKLLKQANIDLDIAALNSEDQTVVAGDIDKIPQFWAICKDAGIKAVVLDATHAFHSRHMDTMLEAYREIAKTVSYSKKATCPYISGMEGKLLEGSEVNADYWVRHTRKQVSFLTACQAVKQLGCEHFLEIGPQPVLSTFALQNFDCLPISCYPSLRRNTDDWETILTSLGKLYLSGFEVDWVGFDKPYIRKKVSNLPFYPFHRKSFWVDCHRSNINKVHPLLGHPLATALNEHIFENEVTIKAMPYLKDHCIGNLIVFPGAGFTEMCLSAGYCVANCLTGSLDKPGRPMALENVTIQAPLELKEGKICRLQTVVKLQESQDGNSLRTGFECRVYHQNETEEGDTGSQKNWVLHCSAKFFPIVNTSTLLQNWNHVKIGEIMATQEARQMGGFYKSADTAGLKFGDAFKPLQRHWFLPQENGMDEIVAEMKCPEDSDKYVLHPVIIDTMIQTALLCGWRNHQSEALRVPIRIGKLTFLNSFNGQDIGKDGLLCLHAKWHEGDKCSVFVSTKAFTPIALLEDIEVIETNVKTIQSVLAQQISQIPDSWEEIWKPIPGPHDNPIELTELAPIFSRAEFQANLKAIENLREPEDESNAIQMDRLVYLYTMQALFKLGWKPNVGEKIVIDQFCEKYGIQANFAKLVRFYFTTFQEEHGIVEMEMANENENCFWLVTQVSPFYEETVTREADLLYEKLKEEKKIEVVVKIYKKVGIHLAEVLSGKESVLPILFPMDAPSSSKENLECSAEMYYLHHPSRVECEVKAKEIMGTVTSHLRSLSETDNKLSPKKIIRCLEAGSGTGSLSKVALSTLSEIWGTDFEYYFTDISPSFFAKAEKRFEEHKGNLRFCAFNIEESPLEQGIPLNYFDVVLASDVLHATKNLKQCLANLRQTMRPQGTLFFTDTLTQDRGITFVFGLLDGYWRFEDFDCRPHHTCVDGETWRKLLLQSRFEFVHISGSYMDLMGCITAEASGDKGFDSIAEEILVVNSDHKKRWVVFSPGSGSEIASVMKVIKLNGGKVTEVLPPETENDNEEKIGLEIHSALSAGDIQGIIYGWGLDKDIQDQRKIALPFLHIAKFILNMKKPPKTFVVTRGVHAISDSQTVLNPSGATLFGMAKSLKNESSELFVRYIDLDGDTQDLSNTTEQILFEMAMSRDTRERERVQVAYRNGARLEPRFIRATIPKNAIAEDLQLPLSTERYQLVLPETRSTNDLKFDILEDEVIGQNEVEVAIKAYALNFRDIITILKPTKEFENLNVVGLDFAGVVIQAGEKVSSDSLKIGDRVFGVNYYLKNCQLPSHMVIDDDKLLKIPDKMTFCEAATLPTVFATSLHCLMNVARMKSGDTVLIHTGSGGVGLSAIQLAKHIGANIITTAGSPRKRAYLKSLGVEHVFHSRDTSFQEEVLKVTNGWGVDIVLNSITGPGLKEASLNVCTPGARFVEMSKLAVWTEEEVKARRPDVEYTIVDLTVLDRSVWKELMSSIKTYLYEGHTTPIPFVQFDALRIRQALQYFQKAKHIGKVVVTMPEVKTVGTLRTVVVSIFDSESTYIITGGLGGIGFEVCKWMLGKGATDIVLIGRNPPKPPVQEEIERLNNSQEGYNVIVKSCDVGDSIQCKAVFAEIGATCNKPVRGVHHCAGVLRDNLYANQTWNSFSETFTPKVQGTWNVHHFTKEFPLQFFVMYSSMTALAGSPSQANYSSANCFQDAFAHYRYSKGLPATTINWGQWSQIGCAKEINVFGVLPVSVKRMLNGLEEVFRSQRLQVAFGEFESLTMFQMVCPSFKYYLDEKLLKNLEDTSSFGNHVVLKSDEFWKEMDEATGKEEKMTVVMTYTKVILRSALRMDADEAISDDANVKDLGVDSLMLVELKNSIQNLLGSRLTISANMLRDCNTIRDLASCIVNKLYDDNHAEMEASKLSPEELLELLKSDCVLEETIKPDPEYNAVQMPSMSSMKRVLVTGSTGQLGPYVISSIIKRMPTLEKIFCLIRTKDGSHPEDRFCKIIESMNLQDVVDMSKVECLRGDLTQTEFGLESEKYGELANSIDCVIHLAAKSNHLESYCKPNAGEGSDVRSVNVEGTLNILRFAAFSKLKRVYYASSAGAVFGESVDGIELNDNWPEMEEMKILAENDIPGYPISKYVCEMLMKQANERGIPCQVFRFPWIMGDSSSGQLNYVHNHYILRFLSYLKIKAMPDAPLPAIVLPVDICAELSVQMFLNENAPNEIYNILHPEPQLEAEFVKVAKQEFDTEVELVEWESKEFMDKLFSNGMPMESLKEIYKDVDTVVKVSNSTEFKAIQGYVKTPQTYFRNSKVERFLPNFANSLPTSMEIIRKDLVYVKSTDVFKNFGI